MAGCAQAAHPCSQPLNLINSTTLHVSKQSVSLGTCQQLESWHCTYYRLHLVQYTHPRTHLCSSLEFAVSVSVACRSYSDERSGGRGASMNNCRSQL